MNLTPAYGRDYKSKTEVLADFVAGKDFVLSDFRGETYVNIADLEKEPDGTFLQFRFGKLRKTFAIKLGQARKAK